MKNLREMLQQQLKRAEQDYGTDSRSAKSLRRQLEELDAGSNTPQRRLGAELLSAMQRITAEAGRISLPLLLVQGAEDRLVEPSGAQMLYDKASSRDKTLKVYDGLYHEVFNEPERDLVFGDVEDWLEARVCQPSPQGRDLT